jgi:hypothetical protein
MDERYSAAERAAILRQYERSGLDLDVFAAWAAIPVGRLRGWMRREKPSAVTPLEWWEVEVCARADSQEAERC